MTVSELRLQRLILFAVSLVVIAVELALMRELALRFWEYLGWLVISVALTIFLLSLQSRFTVNTPQV